MLPDVKDSRLIRKRLHEPPDLQAIDPDFREKYDEVKHGETLRPKLTIAQLTPFQRSTLTAVIKKYWRVFSKEGVTDVVGLLGRTPNKGSHVDNRALAL